MNAQMMDNLFVESYMMMNLEITFNGVRTWFEMSEDQVDDVELFRNLLFPEQIAHARQAEFTRMIVYRYEDVFFQVNRLNEAENDFHPLRDVNEPIHQLLLRMMQIRSLRGADETIIDLWVALQKDKASENPKFSQLHGFFEIK